MPPDLGRRAAGPALSLLLACTVEDAVLTVVDEHSFQSKPTSPLNCPLSDPPTAPLSPEHTRQHGPTPPTKAHTGTYHESVALLPFPFCLGRLLYVSVPLLLFLFCLESLLYESLVFFSFVVLSGKPLVCIGRVLLVFGSVWEASCMNRFICCRFCLVCESSCMNRSRGRS